MQLQLEELVTGCKSPTVGKSVPRNCLSEEKRENCKQFIVEVFYEVCCHMRLYLMYF